MRKVTETRGSSAVYLRFPAVLCREPRLEPHEGFFSFNFSSVVVCIFYFYCSVFLVFVLPSGVIKNDKCERGITAVSALRLAPPCILAAKVRGPVSSVRDTACLRPSLPPCSAAPLSKNHEVLLCKTRRRPLDGPRHATRPSVHAQ